MIFNFISKYQLIISIYSYIIFIYLIHPNIKSLIL